VLFLGLTGGALGVVLIGVGVISLLGGYGVIALAGAAERGGAGVGSSGEC
jgi:hypothetical protein